MSSPNTGLKKLFGCCMTIFIIQAAMPSVAQSSNSTEMSQLSTEIGGSWTDKCASFVDLPENRSESHDSGPGFFLEKYTSTGESAGLNCQVVFNVGYKALLSDRGQAISFAKGRTEAETQENAYGAIKEFLVSDSKFVFRMRRLAERSDLRQDIGLTLVSSVMHSIAQTYAYEKFGINPSVKK